MILMINTGMLGLVVIPGLETVNDFKSVASVLNEIWGWRFEHRSLYFHQLFSAALSAAILSKGIGKV